MDRTNTKCIRTNTKRTEQAQGQSAQDQDMVKEKPHVMHETNTNGRDKHKNKMHRTNTKYTKCIEQYKMHITNTKYTKCIEQYKMHKTNTKYTKCIEQIQNIQNA